MITDINDFKFLLNESAENPAFNANDVKYETPLYQEILDLGFIDSTSDLQHKRGVLQFTSNATEEYRTYWDRRMEPKQSNWVYTIYPNGKLRLGARTHQHITRDLNKPLETVEELNYLFEALIKSAKRLINTNTNEALENEDESDLSRELQDKLYIGDFE